MMNNTESNNLDSKGETTCKARIVKPLVNSDSDEDISNIENALVKQSSQQSSLNRNIRGPTLVMRNEYEKNSKKYFTAFFLLGIINNAGYVVVGTAAQDLAQIFKFENLMSGFLLALILISAIVKWINSIWLMRIRHKYKIWSITLGWILGYG